MGDLKRIRLQLRQRPALPVPGLDQEPAIHPLRRWGNQRRRRRLDRLWRGLCKMLLAPLASCGVAVKPFGPL